MSIFKKSSKTLIYFFLFFCHIVSTPRGRYRVLAPSWNPIPGVTFPRSDCWAQLGCEGFQIDQFLIKRLSEVSGSEILRLIHHTRRLRASRGTGAVALISFFTLTSSRLVLELQRFPADFSSLCWNPSVDSSLTGRYRWTLADRNRNIVIT